MREVKRKAILLDFNPYKPNVSKRVIDSFSEEADALEGRFDGHKGEMVIKEKSVFLLIFLGKYETEMDTPRSFTLFLLQELIQFEHALLHKA